MALQNYVIQNFKGIDQSQTENKLDPGCTVDCANMNIENGDLCVGYGYAKNFAAPAEGASEYRAVPGTGDIHRMYFWHTLRNDLFIVCAGNEIYAWSGTGWIKIHDYSAQGMLKKVEITTELDYWVDKDIYFQHQTSAGTKTFTYNSGSWDTDPETYGIYLETDKEDLKDGDTITATRTDFNITSKKWDFVECRIDEDDYLLIANGQTQIVKWKGTLAAGSAEIFGTGSYVFNTTANKFNYNAVKAISVSYKEITASVTLSQTMASAVTYAVADGVGTFTLTMPSGWSYLSGCAVAFLVPQELGAATTIKVVAGSNTHTLSLMPTWSAGDVAMVTLNTTTTASETNGSTTSTTGVFKLTMPDSWTFSEGCYVAFDIPKDMSALTYCRVMIGGTIYSLSYAPVWSSGDVAVVKLYGTSAVQTLKISGGTVDTDTTTSNVKTIKLKDLPTGWAYEENGLIGFELTTAIASGTTSVKVVAGGVTYELNSVPTWAVGDYCIVQLNSATKSLPFSETKASSYTYSVSNYVGTYTLIMPTGWTYSYGSIVSIALTSGSVHDTLSKLIVKIGTDEFVTTDIPEWEAGNTVHVKLGTGRSGKPETDTNYGIESVELVSAIPDAWLQRCKNIGLVLDGTSHDVEKIDDTKKIVTFKEPISETDVADEDKLKLGCTARIRGMVSDISVNYCELYYSRLLSAGDPEHPSRLYWSQPPGDFRTIEDWAMDEASDLTGGGYTEVGNVSSDPIVGLVALSNQLLIFKEASVYRIVGDKPTNYIVSRVNKDLEKTSNSAIIANGDVPYWMTKAGLYYHDGQQAHLAPTARMIQTILESADLTLCKSCENRDRLYYTLKTNASGTCDDSMVIFDMKEKAYLLRNGFHIIDLCAYDGTLYSINENRFVYKWDKNCRTYDGDEIDAYWYTPKTDLQSKTITKAVKWLYLRGEGEKIKIDVSAGPYVQHESYYMPAEGDVLRIPLKNEGRTVRMKLYNERGSWFKVEGGITLRFEDKED